MNDKYLVIKNNIRELIGVNKFQEALSLVGKCFEIGTMDYELFSLDGIIRYAQGDYNKAKESFIKGLKLNSEDVDLNYNLACVLEHIDIGLAYKYYDKTMQLTIDHQLKEQIRDKLNTLGIRNPDLLISKEQKKINIFVKENMDSFLKDIIKEFSYNYEVNLIKVTNLNQINDEINNCDIAWFEWCDELIIYASKMNKKIKSKIICRLHSYEAFTNNINEVKWENIDKVVFVSSYIRDFVIKQTDLKSSIAVVVPNGLSLADWTYKERNHGKKIAYIGYINYKKGPMLLLNAFNEIVRHDSSYELHIAGEFQDPRDSLYFNQMIPLMNLEKNIFFYGWIDNLNEWMEDKNYVICSSLLESQNMSVMQAMSKGIKPLIHNFAGAKNIYPEEFLWNDFRGLLSMLNEKYKSEKYFKFIADKYSSFETGRILNEVIESLIHKETKIKSDPLVTIGVTSFNDMKNLKKNIASILNQSYLNIELIISDDGSTDGSYEYITSLSKSDKRVISFCHKDNSGGASRGINEIYSNAKGKYVQWIACDDLLLPNSIQLMVDKLESNNDIDYVYSDLTIIDENDVVQGQWFYGEVDSDEVIKQIVSKRGAGVIPMNGMHRREFLTRNKLEWIVYNGNDYSADTINCMQFVKCGWKFKKNDFSCIAYRVHNNNLSHSLKRRLKSIISIYDYVFENFDISEFYNDHGMIHKGSLNEAKMYYRAFKYLDLINVYKNMKATETYLKFGEDIANVLLYSEEYLVVARDLIEQGMKLKGPLLDNFIQLDKFYKEITNEN